MQRRLLVQFKRLPKPKPVRKLSISVAKRSQFTQIHNNCSAGITSSSNESQKSALKVKKHEPPLETYLISLHQIISANSNICVVYLNANYPPATGKWNNLVDYLANYKTLGYPDVLPIQEEQQKDGAFLPISLQQLHELDTIFCNHTAGKDIDRAQMLSYDGVATAFCAVRDSSLIPMPQLDWLHKMVAEYVFILGLMDNDFVWEYVRTKLEAEGKNWYQEFYCNPRPKKVVEQVLYRWLDFVIEEEWKREPEIELLWEMYASSL